MVETRIDHGFTGPSNVLLQLEAEARADATAKAGIDRDAADAAFHTTCGNAWLIDRSIAVRGV